ncbi:NfeD family protein [Paenibacillus tengchongensis]|uniref:NfeD family protein n=1 Tax=Paenibacillus tengchongensis TaxID=2608684 RepID=UPI001FE45AF8|nr:NfeD family protein [Paenibacillus tengchongensis]
MLVVEMFALTFYLLWLCIGCVAAALISFLFPEAIILQVAVGSVAALVLTVFTKPLAAKLRGTRGFHDTGVEIVGRQGIVVEPIVPGRYGQVKVGGDTWSATSVQALGKDEAVMVIRRGNTIIEVERWGDGY